MHSLPNSYIYCLNWKYFPQQQLKHSRMIVKWVCIYLSSVCWKWKIFAKNVLTETRRPISTDANKTPKKAPMQARKSSLSIFQILWTSLRSIRPGRADRMIEARIAIGVQYNSLMKNSNDISTVMAITIFDTVLSHPALKFTAVRENEPAYSWKSYCSTIW